MQSQTSNYDRMITFSLHARCTNLNVVDSFLVVLESVVLSVFVAFLEFSLVEIDCKAKSV